MREVYQIITAEGWLDGSGWTYSQELDYDNNISVTDDMMDAENFDWDWYTDEPESLCDGDGFDVSVTVKWYESKDAYEGGTDPIFEVSAWESEIRKKFESNAN